MPVSARRQSTDGSLAANGKAPSPRIVFLPDRSVDAEGDIFYSLVERLGIEQFEIDTNPEGADFVAFVGRERARELWGKEIKTGHLEERWHRRGNDPGHAGNMLPRNDLRWYAPCCAYGRE